MESSSPSSFDLSRGDRRLPGRLMALRRRGYRGMTILRHRAFQTLQVKPRNLIASAAVASVVTLAWLMTRPAVGRLWGALIEVWLGWLGLPGTVAVVESGGAFFRTAMPQVSVLAMQPDGRALINAGVLTAVALLVSFFLPARLTPFRYLLRALSFIQATALVFFGFFPGYFQHNVPAYISTMLESTMAFISSIPAILGFTFFIFDFSLARKVLLTAMIMVHLVLLAPHQYLVHAYVIANWSLVFMPLLYIIFGLLPQITIFIAFYSWGMSWSGRDLE